ncbi:MAG: HEAT repeat domain-containing protein [Nitrospirae bacterium]|nr:HEAT repeat domain-containing protein [Nitrospirota bacterium]
MERHELQQMIADYMEKGFLENIIDMFKHDPSLYEMIGDLIKDERMRVKLGITALMEELARERPEEVKKALPSLYPLLEDINPTVRGDAANLIGIIGDPEGLERLRPLLEDENPQVVEIAREFLVR